MARTLVNSHQLAPFSGSTSNQIQVDSLIFSGPGGGAAAKDAALNMTSGSIDKVGTIYFSDGTTGTAGSIAGASSGIQLYGNTDIDGTLTANTSLTLDAVTITTAEITVLDGVTAGTAAASKALVLDGSKNIATIGTVGCGAITSTGNSAMAQLTTSGRVIVDDATEATSTTDGSLQTDGGLSVVKDAVFGDDVKLLTDSAVLSLGAGSDATFTHDGTTGVVIAASPITLDSGDDIILDAEGADVILKDGGTEFGRFTNSSTDFVMQSAVSDKDILFKGNDGGSTITALTLDMSAAGAASFNSSVTAVGSFIIGSADMSEADLEQLDGITKGTAAANKAMVTDASNNIASLGTLGCGAITSTGNSAMAQLTTSGRVIVDDATEATNTTDGSLQTDGGLSVAKDIVAGDDVKLLSDGAVLAFGAGGDTTLTHVADQALLLNSTRAMSFGDSGTYIHQASDGVLKLAADGTLLLSTPVISAESADANEPVFQLKNTNADANGSILRFTKDGASVADNDVIGVMEFVSEDDASNSHVFAQMVATIADASAGAEGGRLEFKVAEHDGTVTTGLKLQDGDADGEIDVTLGARANSVVTIPRNLSVAGTTTTVNTVTMEAANAIVFEGATADAHETTLSIVDPTADHIFYLPDLGGSATSAYVAAFAASPGTTLVTSTPAELNLLDGGTSVGSSVTVADSDGMILNDAGTMKTIPMSDIKTYVAASLDIDGYSALGGTGVAQGDHFVFSDGGTEKKITFSNMEDAIFGNVSGDATIAAGGALTIAAGAVENSMLADDAVGADELAANAVVEASIVDNAVTLAKMAGLARGKFIYGDSSGDPAALAVGSAHQFLQADGTDLAWVSMSGDVTLAAGVATIQAASVEGSMLNNNIVSGLTDIGGAIAAADEMIVSDNGVIKRTDVSRLGDFLAAGSSGIGVASGQLTVDFEIDTVIGSSGHNYASATGVYTLGEIPVSGSEMVFLNGQMLMRGADLAAGDYTCSYSSSGSVELHPDLKLDGDDVLSVYYLGT